MAKAMASTDPMVKKRPARLASRFSRSNSPDPHSGPSTTVPSPATSVDSGHRAFSIESLKRRTWRSFSGSSKDRDGPLRPDARKLSKSRPLSTASSLIGPPSRRDSAISDGPDRLSLSTTDRLSIANASLVSSASSCSPAIDWKAQRVEGAAPLETESVLLKIKAPYLVVTTNYLVKMKSRADAAALLPELATGDASHDANGPAPEPLLVIPTEAIVSVFAAETTRSSSGLEVWWKSPLPGPSVSRSDFFFANPTARNDQLHRITRAMRASAPDDDNSPVRASQAVESLLQKIAEAEEPKLDRKPDIFPVVPRGNTRREYIPKMEDATKKPQECPAFYLVLGTYLCHLVEVQQGKAGKPVCRHKTYGIVTLESFRGEWALHEERFSITFRYAPFSLPSFLPTPCSYSPFPPALLPTKLTTPQRTLPTPNHPLPRHPRPPRPHPRPRHSRPLPQTRLAPALAEPRDLPRLGAQRTTVPRPEGRFWEFQAHFGCLSRGV